MDTTSTATASSMITHSATPTTPTATSTAFNLSSSPGSTLSFNTSTIPSTQSPSNGSSTDGGDSLAMQFLFVSIETCAKTNRRAYCHYASFLILLGYVCHMFVFPLLVMRMRELKSRFRNQYNLSFLWLCCMLLMTAIDILEFTLSLDARLFSVAIFGFATFFFVACLTTMLVYMRRYSSDGSFRQNSVAMVFTIFFFIAIVIVRLSASTSTSTKWSKSKSKTGSLAWYLVFFGYFLVYCGFATVQVKKIVLIFLFFVCSCCC